MPALTAALAAAPYGTPELDDVSAAKCRALIRGYHARWADDTPWVPTSVERFVGGLRLYNPDTGRPSKFFKIGGKLDLGVRAKDGGETAIVDHKTCSEDIEASDAPYWDHLAIEGQVSHYHLLEWLAGRKADTAIWDVVRKPDIRPRKVSKADAAAVVGVGEYCGDRTTEADQAEMGRTGRETPAMYEARLAQDCTHTRPERYFQRRRVPRLDSEILEYARELWGHGQDILAARKAQRWPRTGASCFAYNRPCQFLGVCSNRDTIDSDNWRRKGRTHSELPIEQGHGFNLLTISRIKCWQRCQREHYYKYELGIERNTDEAESEALYFGSALHSVFEAYFGALVE